MGRVVPGYFVAVVELGTGAAARTFDRSKNVPCRVGTPFTIL
jgi:hypothetical protein